MDAWISTGPHVIPPLYIQWAAFFDCKYGVLEMIPGHRLTLAYNLYWVNSGLVSIANGFDVMEPKSIRLFTTLWGQLERPNFLPKGENLNWI